MKSKFSTPIFTNILSRIMISFSFSILVLQSPLNAGDRYAKLSKERIHLYEVDSTQTFSRENAVELLKEPGKWVVITADHQTEGSSVGNLYATFMTLYPTTKTEEFSHILQISSLSLAKILEKLRFENVEIKWPDEILINEKKVARFSFQAIPSLLSGHSYLLIGIELNINTTSDEIADLSESETISSLAIEKGESLDKEKILRYIAQDLRQSFDQFLGFDFETHFYPIIENFLAFKNHLVEVELASKSVVRGRFVGIDKEDCIILEMGHDKFWKIERGKILRTLDPEKYESSEI